MSTMTQLVIVVLVVVAVVGEHQGRGIHVWCSWGSSRGFPGTSSDEGSFRVLS